MLGANSRQFLRIRAKLLSEEATKFSQAIQDEDIRGMTRALTNMKVLHALLERHLTQKLVLKDDMPIPVEHARAKDPVQYSP